MGASGSGSDRNETSGGHAAPRRIGLDVDAPIGTALGTQTGLQARQKRAPSTWHARIFVFLSVGFLWLLLSWSLTFHHTLLLVLWPISTLLVVWLCDQLGVVNDETTPLELTLTTIRYVPWLAWQVVMSSATVLRHAWWPGAGIRPKTGRVESRTQTELGLASYANSITLTPGTLSLEAESLATARAQGGDSAWILVHSLTRQGLEDLRGGAMDDQIVRVEAPLRKHFEAQREAQKKRRSGGDS